MKYYLFITLVFTFCKIKGQVPKIYFSNEHKIIINDYAFSKGQLSLSKIRSALNEKYKRGRNRNQSIRHFLYKFKKSHIVFESESYEVPSDQCRSIRICFRKKDKQFR